jgi:hypothetical protein
MEIGTVRIAHVRRDYLHEVTTTISQNHAMVCIEDLQVRNMSKSAAGSAEAPGRNVRAKSGLNTRIRQLFLQVIDSYDYEFKNVYYSRANCCGAVGFFNFKA